MGASVFVPRITTRRFVRRQRVWETTIQPLFPTYLFVQEGHNLSRDLLDRFLARPRFLSRDNGVYRVVRSSTLEALKLALVEGLYDYKDIVVPKHTYRPGDRVVIDKNNVENLCGIVTKLLGEVGLVVETVLMGRAVPVGVSYGDVRAA